MGCMCDTINFDWELQKFQGLTLLWTVGWVASFVSCNVCITCKKMPGEVGLWQTILNRLGEDSRPRQFLGNILKEPRVAARSVLHILGRSWLIWSALIRSYHAMVQWTIGPWYKDVLWQNDLMRFPNLKKSIQALAWTRLICTETEKFSADGESEARAEVWELPAATRGPDPTFPDWW